jgi:hypothetical protein
MHRPDYLKFHESLTEELYSLKDRIRNLVKHWPTDGEHKESALRALLRRHLPPSLVVGRGFVVTKDEASEQIDVLIVDGSAPTLFKDGDLMIVTPDAVVAAVEAKTKSRWEKELKDDLVKFDKKGSLCEKALGKGRIWTGFFIYDGEISSDNLLHAIAHAKSETGFSINCVCYGKTGFVRYWTEKEVKDGAVSTTISGAAWHAYEFDKEIAPSYFMGNFLDFIARVHHETSSFAWFPMIGGKEQFRRKRLKEEDLSMHDPN